MLSLSQQKFLTSLHHKKYRQKYRNFIVEGDKLVAELLEQRRVAVVSLYGLDGWAAARADLLQPFLEKFVPVTENELKKISTLTTPNQVLAVAEIPGLAPLSGREVDAQKAFPRAFYLDAIQDPGNLGAILRVADWFGLSPVFCSPDCVDAYSPKVVQAGMGAVLRVPVIEIALDELLTRTPGLPLLGAVLDGADVFRAELPPRGLIVIGNESRGISPAVGARLTQRLSIPRPEANSGAESLNAAVAAGILAAVWVIGGH